MMSQESFQTWTKQPGQSKPDFGLVRKEEATTSSPTLFDISDGEVRA